tara:strand:+ start:57 stop:347 length:291 start_codon:yes stop_codon:yes gene_type:complete
MKLNFLEKTKEAYKNGDQDAFDNHLKFLLNTEVQDLYAWKITERYLPCPVCDINVNCNDIKEKFNNTCPNCQAKIEVRLGLSAHLGEVVILNKIEQ